MTKAKVKAKPKGKVKKRWLSDPDGRDEANFKIVLRGTFHTNAPTRQALLVKAEQALRHDVNLIFDAMNNQGTEAVYEETPEQITEVLITSNSVYDAARDDWDIDNADYWVDPEGHHPLRKLEAGYGGKARAARPRARGGKPRTVAERRAELIRYGINPDEMVARALGRELPPATTPKERFRRSLIRHGINPDAPIGGGRRGGKQRAAGGGLADAVLKLTRR